MKFTRPRIDTRIRTSRLAFRLSVLISIWAVSTVYSAHVGHGYAQDFSKGLEAYKRKQLDAAQAEFRPLADAGQANAQYYMGIIHLQRSEILKALAYFKLSAAQGTRSAQYNLGVIFAKGDGVSKDFEEAIKWYALAGEQGHPNAQFNLGVFYRDGLGTTVNGRKAVEWFTKAAENGNVFAQINLARIYTLGNVAPKDLSRAYMWLEITQHPFGRTRDTSNRAANARISKVRNSAVEAKILLAEQMSPGDVERAKMSAREWLQKIGRGGN